KYMHTAFIPEGQTAPHPNSHPVTTSFWNGFPRQFWNDRETYPYIDYADIHHYARSGEVNLLANVYMPDDFYDAALFSTKLSTALHERSPEMPVVRGEIGFLDEAIDLFAANGTNGVWLHNLIWSGINAGGLSELYWTGAPTRDHIIGPAHDHRLMYRTFANFMQAVPLNNGRYADAAPTSSTPDLRAWGQMDATAEQAHLWIQNANHTWGNIAQGRPIPPVDGQIAIAGFTPEKSYTVTWWDTYQPDAAQQIIRSEQVATDEDGVIRLEIRGLEGDTAVQIEP
ncbi:MAG: hypothetical protein KC419_26025, partial [Anaerolineales bacterium]|nr:hypothetical protein [Anaerolineales bacterium]